MEGGKVDYNIKHNHLSIILRHVFWILIYKSATTKLDILEPAAETNSSSEEREPEENL